MAINLTGYHGTSKKKLNSIFANGITDSSNGWFGTGSYFYEDSYNMAYKWGEKKNFKEISVLKAEISVEEESLFDLTNPMGADARTFHNARKQNFKKYKAKHKYQLDNLVINSLHRLFDFHVVKGFSHTFEDYDEVSKLGSNVPNGIEIVIRNKQCIKSLMKVE